MPDQSQRALEAGARLGSYEIVSCLGKGGMGEVYRAEDIKLRRDVALKVLPKAFAHDPERFARFRREAQLLASLNHNNIAAIYGFEQSGDVNFLVLELVPGETLRERIAGSGPLPVEEALGIAEQIAEALEAAHEKAIIHRDLKPANIKVTPEGKVKVLDFGLAKAFGGDETTSDPSESPTLTRTREGTILGTAAYMSPEQARGKKVDKRADIWAFGCVLYELLTGKQVFEGETVTEILAAVLKTEPDWTELPAATPASIRVLLRRCLQKDLTRRLRDASDARIEIEDALSEDALSTPAEAPRRRAWAWVAVSLLGALGAGVAAGRWFEVRPATTAPAANVRLQRLTDFIGMEEHPAISPDGKTVAFVALANGRRQVWVRLLAGGAPLQITRNDDDHEHPRWAPDSSALIYYSEAVQENEPGTLWEVSALGGTPRRIASSQGEGDVSHDGRHIATFQKQGNQTVLAVLSRDGSTVERTKRLPALAEFVTPRWSPDDRWIAFVGAIEIAFERAIYVTDGSDAEPQTVARASSIQGIAWMPDSSGLVYASSAGSSMAYPPVFNLRAAYRNGGPERQLTFGDVAYVQPDINPAGRLVASQVRMQSDIWRFPISGSPKDNVGNGVRVTRQTGQVQTPSVSPDGKEIVYLSDSGGHANLWVAKVDGSSSRQITFEQDPEVAIGVPIWSPVEDWIVFVQARVGTTAEWLIRPDGSGRHEFVPRGAGAYWSRDGRWLYYIKSASAGQATTCIEKVPTAGGSAAGVRCEAANMAVSSDGSTVYFIPQVSRPGEIRKAQPEDGPPQPFAYVAQSRIPLVPQSFALSPDDRWLTLPLKDGGTTNIWGIPTDRGPMRQFTDFGQRPTLIARQVSWSPDGKFIYAAVVETDADVVLLDGLLH